MAAAPAAPAVTLAVFIDDDDGIGQFAVTQQDGSVAAAGSGAPQLAATAKVAVINKWRVATLGGLDALKKAAASVHEPALATLAADHYDAAYDFLVDNGYQLSWESLFPDVPIPDTATDAAAIISRWIDQATTTGVIARQTAAGKTVYWPLVAFENGRPRFRTVREARSTLEQDPPDQSWMTGDTPDLVQETSWLHM